MITPDSPTIRRILDRCERTPAGCLRWTGGTSRGGGKKTQKNPGYPSVWVVEEKRSRRGHAVIFEAFHGELPAGHERGHTCGDSLCLDPDHMEAQSKEDNRRERIKRHRNKKINENTTDGGGPR